MIQRNTLSSTLPEDYQYHSAPIFQKTTESLLQGLPKVIVYYNEILVTGVDNKDHLCNLNHVMDGKESAGLAQKQPMCLHV